MYSKTQIIKYLCKNSDNDRLAVDIIAENSDISKSLIKRLMIHGCVFQTIKNKRLRIRKAKRLVRAGNLIECYYDPNINLNEDFDFETLFETKHYGVFLKPIGARTEGTNFGDASSLIRHVENLKKTAFIVNRLGEEVEGLVVVAFDSKTQNYLQEMWKDNVLKRYQAIIEGELTGSGVIDEKINNKFTQTTYNCVRSKDNTTLVDLCLTTERKHQARKHLASLGHPIVGDTIYGIKRKRMKGELDGLLLVSYLIKFKDPYTNVGVKVSLPPDRLLF